jgi:LVIVD repeat
MGCLGKRARAALVAAVGLLALLAMPTAGQAHLEGPTLPTNDLQNLISLTGYPTPMQVPVQDNPQPPLEPVPRAQCGLGSRPLTGEQGRVPASAIDSPEAVEGWTCNVTEVGHLATPGGFRVWRYVDEAGHACAFYDTSLTSPLNVVSVGAGPTPGVAVLDMSDPAHPVQTASLTDLAMLAPHESLNFNAKRGLLAAEDGNGLTLPGLMSIYDASRDCRHPVLDATLLAARFGHESGFSPDGNTFYIGGGEGIAAVDVSDPTKPHTLWEGNEFAHGLNVSDDGKTLYDANPIDGKLTLLDVSQIQSRKPDPQVREISSLTWDTVSVPQNTIPVTIGGHPYLIEFDEFAFRFNPVTISDQVGAARIIDIADPDHPRVVSNIRLEVNQRDAHQAADGDPSPIPAPTFNYSAHYCGVPREVDPEIVACSFINSGLRVFNIEDPLHPREVAYFISPPNQGTIGGLDGGDFAMSQPAFDPARRQVWYTDATSGFYSLRLDNGAWPDAGGATGQAATGQSATGQAAAAKGGCKRKHHSRKHARAAKRARRCGRKR